MVDMEMPSGHITANYACIKKAFKPTTFLNKSLVERLALFHINYEPCFINTFKLV